MLKEWMVALLGKECDSRERLFRMILMTASVVTIISIIETLLTSNNQIVALPLLIILATVVICIILLYKYHKLDMATVLLWFSLNVIVFPKMFFGSGGIDSGAMVWFILVTLYIFVIFKGVKLFVMLFTSYFIDLAVFFTAYQHPEMVIPMDVRRWEFIDAFFSITIVGTVVGCVVKYQISLFEKEQTINQQQKADLTMMSKYKDRFFTNMSHEIRTPINTVIGLNEMILRKSQSEEIQDYARNIQTASKMLLNLVNDILELSQLEMKQMTLVPVEYYSKDMFKEVVEMIRVRMLEKKLEFRISIDENLPSILFGDEKRIKQILLNILTNAVKYTQEGFVTLTVSVESQMPDRIKMKMSVSDTGMGIHKENLKNLFNVFKRLDQRKNVNIEGSGLGLSITKQLVDLMEGEITVDSIYTKGSVFTVIIEQRVVSNEPIGLVDFAKNRSSGERYHYRQSFEAPDARVLVVDDNIANAKVIVHLLEATKVKVDTAYSGMECLQMTRAKYYDVILMDHMMPEMDGIETLIELRKQENGLCRKTPVLALSANTLVRTGNWYINNGFNGYLEKPIEPEKLEYEILKVLPDEIVEYRYGAQEEVIYEDDNIIRKMATRKKKKIYVTSDCVCDIPEYLLKRFDIKLMYYYIKTKDGRFADTREIDYDNLSQYDIVDNENDIKADSVSVEEYEQFFAEALTEAEQVIHIVMATQAGISQKMAQLAARGFDHVKLISSEHISGGEGLLVLHAARLAQEGHTVTEICEEIDRIKDRIISRYIIPDTYYFYRNGYTDKFTNKLCELFQLHPIMKMKHNKIVITGFERGKIEDSWIRFIRRTLFQKWRINTDIIFITHVGCNSKQLQLIQNEILKRIPFKQVIVQKAAFSIACNSGIHSLSLSYYLRSNDNKDNK